MKDLERLRRQIGQRICAGFTGTEVTEEIRKLVREWKVGNILLYSRNVVSFPQLKQLCRDLDALIQEETGQPERSGGERLPDLPDGKVFPGGISVKALFAPDMKWRLVEEFGPHCFTETDDGRLLFTADYTNMDNLVSWILTFGAKAEVLEPAEARNRIRNIAETLEKTYRS